MMTMNKILFSIFLIGYIQHCLAMDNKKKVTHPALTTMAIVLSQTAATFLSHMSAEFSPGASVYKHPDFYVGHAAQIATVALLCKLSKDLHCMYKYNAKPKPFTTELVDNKKVIHPIFTSTATVFSYITAKHLLFRGT